MKILIALCAVLAVCTARVVINAVEPGDSPLLGEHECTWGPSYWCENLKNAAGCHATKHCIKTVWEDMKVPKDNDSVCDICKDMVQQARDQLESNQTQQDLKAVFEGSCKLIHIKPIVRECITIVDQFIPDLVETLASQMDPSVVCSVSGLCNSAHIDKLLIEYEQSELKGKDLKSYSLEKDELEPDECSKCYTVATHMEHKLHNTPRDKILQQMLNLCAELGTFTDACSASILTYFDAIYTNLQDNFNAENVCHLSGQCSGKFHKHEDMDKTLKVEIRPLSSVGMVDVDDDLPCKLCEQLAEHLKDLLVANTTEIEFEQVLKGLCKQTKSFSAECISIVTQYYPQMYEYLKKDFNSKFVCQLSGICSNPDKVIQTQPIWPLLPESAAKKGMQIFNSANKDLENNNDEQLSKSEVEAMQLPIERLVPFPMSGVVLDVKGKGMCTLCQNVLHYIQNVITDPTNESEIKEALGKACKRLPESLQGKCTDFIDLYGDAIAAVLAEEIDPSQVCPTIGLCPTAKMIEMWQNIPAKFTLEEKKDKPSCPLCLFAVSQIYNVVKNNKTEKNIEHALDKLCIHLPQSLIEQCTDLVKYYSKELIELLLADLTPQEVCVFMELCEDDKYSNTKSEFITDKDGEILTNEIPNAPVSSEISEINAQENTPCVLCEFVMQLIDENLGNEKGRDIVETIVHEICQFLPGTVSDKCNRLVNKYGDVIIELITNDISPKQVCTMIALCSNDPMELEETSEIVNMGLNSDMTPDTQGVECSLCEFAVHFIEKELGSEKGKQKVEGAVRGVCKHLPKTVSGKCSKFVDKHADSIIDLIIKNVGSKKLCSAVGLCSDFFKQELEAIIEMSNAKKSLETNDADCVVCEFIMQIIDEELSTRKERAIVENVVHDVCNHLPQTVSDKCNGIVNKYGDVIIELITKGINPKQMCTMITLCSKSSNELEERSEIVNMGLNSEMTPDTESIECSLCEFAVHFIEKELGSEKGKQKVEGAVHGVCKHLPKTVSRKCNRFVDKHGDSIIDLIIKNVGSKKLCSAVGLCSNFFRQELEAIIEMSNAKKSLETNDADCVVCEFIMQIIDEEVSTRKERAIVENVVHDICNHLPQTVSDKCNGIVNKYGDVIIELITKGINPKQMCTMITLCSKSSDELEESSEIVNMGLNSEMTPDTESIECSLCEFAVHFIEKELGSEKGKQKVEGAVHGVCKHLPKTVSRKCNRFVDKHGDSIIDLIIKNVGSKKLCSAVGLCSNFFRQELEAIIEMSNAKISQETNDAQCAVCELAMNTIDKALAGEKAKHKVEAAVHSVCSYLPNSLLETCNKFIGKYANVAIEAIIRKSPKEVCSLIKVCSTYVQEVKASVTQCSVCKSIMSEVDNLLDKEDVDNSIKNVVAKVCHYLPSRVQKECVTIINSYGQSIINLVKRRENIPKICSKISLCAPQDYSIVFLESSRIKRSYEKKKCTWGPVYWCSSNEAARECKAVDHCRTHVWKADFAPPKQLSLSDTEPNETNL